MKSGRPYRLLFLFFTAGCSNTINPRTLSQISNSAYMIKVVKLRLEIRLDCEKAKQTKVKPYVRFRNGKKERVKGYVRKNREL